MKLLHVTDFHGKRDWYAWLSSVANNYDIVCLTGDLVDVVGHTVKDPIREQIPYIVEYLNTWDGPDLFIVLGNHDVWAQVYDHTSGKLLLCNTLVYKPGFKATLAYALSRISNPKVHINVPFTATDYVIHVHPWSHDDTAIFTLVPTKLNIILSHVPPSYTGLDLTKNGAFGSLGLRSVFEATSRNLILCGHAHTPEANTHFEGNTLSLNPGAYPYLKVPTYNEIDTTTGTFTCVRGKRCQTEPLPIKAIKVF